MGKNTLLVIASKSKFQRSNMLISTIKEMLMPISKIRDADLSISLFSIQSSSNPAAGKMRGKCFGEMRGK